ncbi:MAG: hypothetical protein H6706_00785 [Myxococcales bacterium]|nr:hypothetical protein [Myxococcales bacterium]
MKWTAWIGALALTACLPLDEDATDGGAGDAAASCADVICGGSARCEAGACVCNAGLERRGSDCVPAGPAVPADRTEALVCARWESEHRDVAPELDLPAGADACTPADLRPEGQDNAIRRTNLFRWLVGLAEVAYAPALLDGVQACAVVMNQLGTLSHDPPPGTRCYDPIQSAGQSNLAQGTGMADSVDLYVGDRGVDSLGHRRWVLEPGLSGTAFGQRGVFGCMDVSQVGEARVLPDAVAWPPAGFVPVAAAEGRWSIGFFGADPGDALALEIDRGAGFAAADFDVLDRGYGRATRTIAFDVPGAWRAGQRVEVRVSGMANRPDLEYAVQFTDCRF